MYSFAPALKSTDGAEGLGWGQAKPNQTPRETLLPYVYMDMARGGHRGGNPTTAVETRLDSTPLDSTPSSAVGTHRADLGRRGPGGRIIAFVLCGRARSVEGLLRCSRAPDSRFGDGCDVGLGKNCGTLCSGGTARRVRVVLPTVCRCWEEGRGQRA